MDETRAADRALLAEAVALSVANVASGGGPFGAVIVLGGAVVGRGANSVTRNCDPTAHAEVVAIRDACANLARFDLSGATLYTSCEPCPMCLSAAYWAKLSRIVFAATRHDAAAANFDDARLYDEIPLPHAARSLVCEHHAALQPDAVAAFTTWTASPERIVYGESPADDSGRSR